MSSKKLKKSVKQNRPGGSLKRVVGTHRPATLQEMGIITDEDYNNYVNDYMAGHASIYHRKLKPRRPVRPNEKAEP